MTKEYLKARRVLEPELVKKTDDLIEPLQATRNQRRKQQKRMFSKQGDVSKEVKQAPIGDRPNSEQAAHEKIHEVEKENVAIESAHKPELLCEAAAQHVLSQSRSRYKKIREVEKKVNNADKLESSDTRAFSTDRSDREYNVRGRGAEDDSNVLASQSGFESPIAEKEYLKAKDKVVRKMTRDGAVEENLTTGKTKRISKRIKDAELVKKTGEVDEPLQSTKSRRRLKQRSDSSKQDDTTRETQRTFIGDRSNSERTARASDDRNVSEGGNNREYEDREPDEVGRTAEQLTRLSQEDNPVTVKKSSKNPVPIKPGKIRQDTTNSTAVETTTTAVVLENTISQTLSVQPNTKDEEAHTNESYQSSLQEENVLKQAHSQKSQKSQHHSQKHKRSSYEKYSKPEKKNSVRTEHTDSEQKHGKEKSGAKTNQRSEKNDELKTHSKKVQKLEHRSEKAHKKLDKAYKKLPKKKVVKPQRVFDEDKGRAHTKLRFEETLKPQKQQSGLRFEAKQKVKQISYLPISKAHEKIHEVEKENSGVEAAHKAELLGEDAARHVLSKMHRRSPYEKYSELENKVEKTDRKLRFESYKEEHAEMQNKKDMNKFYQRSRNKEAARKANNGYDSASDSAKSIKATAEKVAEKVQDFIKNNKILFAWIGVGLLIIILCSSIFASCTAMISSVSTKIAGTTYLSEDSEIIGAEGLYKAMEDSLQTEIDAYESTHDYDEYVYNLDEIYHDPYVLISFLSATHDGEFELSEVEAVISALFESQYTLTESVTVETRYRTVTQIVPQTYIDPYTGLLMTIPVEIEVEEPYDYYICTVTLTSEDLDGIVRSMLDEDQLALYESYLEFKGNREDLFE